MQYFIHLFLKSYLHCKKKKWFWVNQTCQAYLEHCLVAVKKDKGEA